MKICSKCHRELSEDNFAKNRSRKDGLSCWCKECNREYERLHSERRKEQSKRWHKNNREKVNAYEREYRKTRRANLRELVMDNKTVCVKCGEHRKYVLDFHHKDHSQKKFNISTNIEHRNKQELLDEISKCVCLCRNCHSEFHYFYGVKPEKPVEALTEYLSQ